MTSEAATDRRLRDDRGRLVTQIDPVVLHLLRRHEMIPAQELKAIESEVGTGLPKTARPLGWIYVPVCVIMLLAGVDLTYQTFGHEHDLTWLVRRLLPFLVLVVAPLGLWSKARQVRSRRIRRVMLAHRHCPHCAYDVRGLPAEDEERVTVCPECGCAWILESCTSAESEERRWFNSKSHGDCS